jgi:large subunit ribosomal protein L11
MAKKLQKQFTLHMTAGKATPAPPIWPILGQHGINIGAFVKEFNDKTQDIMQKYWGASIKVPAVIRVYIDRSYDMTLMSPITPDLIKYKAKITAGSGEPNKKKVARLTQADLEEIVDIKMSVMNTQKRESIMKTIIGTAKSLGVEIV